MVAMARRSRSSGMRLQDHGAHLRVRILGVEQQGAGLAQRQGRLVQVPHGAQPLLLAQALGLGSDVGDQQVQHIQGIIERA